MHDLNYKPTGYSYRVDDNVWAGEYPVWEWEQGARMRQLKLFTDFGISCFLDLTESGEMPPYAPLLPDCIGRCSFSIPNGSIPNGVEKAHRELTNPQKHTPPNCVKTTQKFAGSKILSYLCVK